MKLKYTAFIIIAILALDQIIKIYIKTHFYMGEDVRVLGNWFHLHFIENPGMAWGMKFGGDWGKMALTIFRLIAVIWGTFYIKKIVKAEMPRGFIICVCLIYAGAAGNLIDSIFYGKIFNLSDPYLQNIASIFPKDGGYAPFLHGRVVDMFYFPIVDIILPKWIPYWGGTRFTFFDPVFNLADMSISCGVISLLVFQAKFFPKKEEKSQPE